VREIQNTRNRPIRIPLPGGKVLHLNPGKIAQVSDQALNHIGLRSLIDEGLVELLGKGDHGEGFSSTAADAVNSHGHARSAFHRRLSGR